MEIKPEKIIPLGTIIKRIVVSPETEIGVVDGIDKKTKVQKLIAIEHYKHHVLFRELKPPYLKTCVTNNELYQMGVYHETDFLKEFAK